MKWSFVKDVKLLWELGKAEHPCLPARKHPTDAGIDLPAYGDYLIKPHSSKIVRTGIEFEYPEGTMGLVKPKSKNDHLIGAGVADVHYRGEVLVKVVNYTTDYLAIKHGDQIAQLIIVPILTPELEYVQEINKDTDRGNSGGIVSQLEKENGNEIS